MQITDVYAGYFNVYIDPTATCTVNDAVGVFANVTLVGPFTQGAVTSAIAALKGNISNSSTGSYDGQVFNLMLSYGSDVDYGDDTALIMGYTHSNAHCDYGFYLKNYSPNMVAGIYITEVAGASPAMTYGIHIDADCGTALQIGATGEPAGDVIWYGTTAGHLVWFDEDGDTNGAVYIGADTKGLMFNLYGDVTGCGVFWDPSTDTNGTLSVGATGGSKGVDMFWYGATASATMQWDQGTDDLLFAGAASIKVSGATTIGLEISGGATGISIGACTGAGIAFTGASGTGLDTGVILVAADQAGAPLAFGSNAVNVAVERIDVTCQQTAGSIFLGQYLTIATSGDFDTVSMIQGILSSITVAHQAQEVYGVRGSISITAAQTGDTSNQFIGLYGAVSVDAALALALADTGGIYGVFGSVAIGAGGACDQPMQAGYFETTGIKSNIVGETSVMKLWAGGGGDTYTDYGLNVALESNNIVSAIHLATLTSCVCPIGIEFAALSGSFTAAFAFPAAGTAPVVASATGAGVAGEGSIVILIDGTPKYLQHFAATA